MELKKKKLKKCKIQGDHNPGNSEFTQEEEDGKKLGVTNMKLLLLASLL